MGLAERPNGRCLRSLGAAILVGVIPLATSGKVVIAVAVIGALVLWLIILRLER